MSQKTPRFFSDSFPLDQALAFVVFILCLLLAIYLQPPLLNDVSTNYVQV